MDNLTAGNPRAHRVRLYYDGTATINEGMPLCYNYLTTENWWGGSVSDGAVSATNTTAEGSQNEGKYIRVCSPVIVSTDDGTPSSGSKLITSTTSGDYSEFNDLEVGMWVVVTGTDITNGTYKVTAVTQGEDSVTAGTVTLDMDDASGTTADVAISINNYSYHAGAVAKGGWVGQTGPKVLDVYVPNGAIVPIRTDKSCVIGDGLGLGNTAYEAITGDGEAAPCATSMEVVNRSSVDGVVLAKLYETGQQISAQNARFNPVRSSATSGREYGIFVEGSKFFTGTTAAQTYLVMIEAEKPATADTTGDGYGGLLYIKGNNYAQNDTNYTFRGLNVSINNRSGGTLGNIYNTISLSLKQTSGNITNATALQIDAQDLTSGTKTTFGGLDVAMNREGTAATEEYGIRVRTRGTINTAMNTVFRIDKDATDHGFVNLFNIEIDAVDVISASGDLTFTTSDILIPVVFNTNTYYIVCTDNA